MNNVNYCVNKVVDIAQQKHKVNPKHIVAAGVTNQRETTIPWVLFIRYRK
jgi:glycerol kinase